MDVVIEVPENSYSFCTSALKRQSMGLTGTSSPDWSEQGNLKALVLELCKKARCSWRIHLKACFDLIWRKNQRGSFPRIRNSASVL